MSKNILEVREYNFSDGTLILVELDKRTKKISFVEWNNHAGRYIPKKWDFSGRELQYMNGWLNILKAMEYVINDCKTTMAEWEKEEANKLINILGASND